MSLSNCILTLFIDQPPPLRHNQCLYISWGSCPNNCQINKGYVFSDLDYSSFNLTPPNPSVILQGDFIKMWIWSWNALLESLLLKMAYQASCNLVPAFFWWNFQLLLLFASTHTVTVFSSTNLPCGLWPLFFYIHYHLSMEYPPLPCECILPFKCLPLWSFPWYSSKKSIVLHNFMYLFPSSINSTYCSLFIII